MAGELRRARAGGARPPLAALRPRRAGRARRGAAPARRARGLAAELQQPLYRHSSLAWGCVWAALAGRFEEAERLAATPRAWPSTRERPDAPVHFTAQLVALRREQGRLDELLPEIERFARRARRGRHGAASCRSPISTPATAPRAGRLRPGARGGGRRRSRAPCSGSRRMGALGEAAAELGDADGSAAAATPRSSPTRTFSCSGASPATPAPCTGCWAARRPSPAARPRARTTSRPPWAARGARRRAAAGPHALRLRRAAAPRPGPPTARGPRLLREAGVAARRLGCAASPRGRSDTGDMSPPDARPDEKVRTSRS